jgi:hypothetical protein
MVDVPTPEVRLRYFCMALPGAGRSAGFEYLEALSQTGYGVKACAIGPAFLMSGPWPALMSLFTGPEQVAKRFVNIVCAAPGLLMGQALRAVDVKPPAGPGLPSVGSVSQNTDEVIYRPQTALSGLYTVGVPNVAITAAHPILPDEHEVTALSKYDAILTITDEDARTLKHLGLLALYMPPEKDQLTRLMKSLLEPVTPPV